MPYKKKIKEILYQRKEENYSASRGQLISRIGIRYGNVISSLKFRNRG